MSYNLISCLLQFREDPPPYTSPVRRFESFENPLAFESSQDEEQDSSGNPQYGSALYDFTAGGDDEVSFPQVSPGLAFVSLLLF